MAFKIKDGVRVGTLDVFNDAGTLLVNAPTATKWATARTITLGGDLTGNVSIDGSANVTLTATIAADSVALGTDTTGNYVASISAGSSAITVTGSGSENAAITIDHGDTSALTGAQGGTGIAGITVDSNGHVTAVSAATYLTSEADTLQTVTGRGATSNVATVSLSGTTVSSSTSTGVLVVTGGVGIGGALNVGGAGSIAGNLTIGGNLVVNGTTTTVNSTTTTLDDPIITLGGDTVPITDDNKDRGVEFRWHNGTSAKLGFFGYDDSTGKFTFIPDTANAAEVFSGTTGEIDAKIDYSNILNQPTIGNASLTLNIGAAAATNNTLTVATGTGFSANSASNQTYSLSIGPALTALAATMTGAGTGFLRKNGADTYSLDTTTYLTSAGAVTSFSAGTTGLTPSTGTTGAVTLAGTLAVANGGTGATTNTAARTNLGATTVGSNLFTLTNPSAVTFLRLNADNTVTALSAIDFRTAIGAGSAVLEDTLATVTGRGATTTTAITIPSATLAVSGTATVNLAPIVTTIASTTLTAVDNWAVATYRSGRYTIQITQGSNYQISEILVIHNGTTTYMTEYAVLESSGSALGTFTTDISGGNARLLVTMASATSATFKVIRNLIVV
jgi:hypothetical protein